MEFKENKWYNLGDVNPRIHGGTFVKRDGDDIEIVETINNKETYGGHGYTIQRRDESVKDLVHRYEELKKGIISGVANSCDWKRFIALEKSGWKIDAIVMFMASDMMSYYGGACENDIGNNYWELLGSDGIKPNNFF